ncbi:DUF2076 domain-containing protein [Paracidovorax avenae]|uniref:DUF2076 domain-containing protein n=1 Tax=Paracidovorax avenae TaxID=80867 RepID=UPI0006B3092E|nr:DUF2076 domain-containing protein [Paracidovorax avenae]
MTPNERPLLDDLLQRLVHAGPAAKDSEADSRIHQALAAQPDALYLLVQRCLLLERGLAHAQEEVARLKQAADSNRSFIGADLEPGFGRAPSQAYSPGAAAAQSTSMPPQAPPAGYAQPAPAPGWRDRLFGNASAPAAAAPAGPGFLGTAASTAAGVAGGMFLFNGLEHLLGNRGSAVGNGLLGGGALLPQETVVQNITNENFYDSRGNDDSRDAGWLPDDSGPAFDDDGGNFL